MQPLGGSLPFGADGDEDNNNNGSDASRNDQQQQQPPQQQPQPQRRSATVSPAFPEQHSTEIQRRQRRATEVLHHQPRLDLPLLPDQLDAAAALQNPYYWNSYAPQPPFSPSLSMTVPGYPTPDLQGSGGQGEASTSFLPAQLSRESSLAAGNPPNWLAAAALQQRGEASGSSSASRSYDNMQFLPQANQFYHPQHARAATFAGPSSSATSSPVRPLSRMSTTGASPAHSFGSTSDLGSTSLPRGSPLMSHNAGYPIPSVLVPPAPLPPVPLHAPSPVAAVPLAPASVTASVPAARPSTAPAQPPPPQQQQQFIDASAPEVRTRRAIIACRFCRSRKLRCDGEERCRQCARRGEECVYTLPPAAQRRADGRTDAAAAAAAAAASSAGTSSSGSASGSTGTAPVLLTGRRPEQGTDSGELVGAAGRAPKRRGGPGAAATEKQSSSADGEASALQSLPVAYGGAAAPTAYSASSRASHEEGSSAQAARVRHSSETSAYTDLRSVYATPGAGPSNLSPLDARRSAESPLYAAATSMFAPSTSTASPHEQQQLLPSVLYESGEQQRQLHTRSASPHSLPMPRDSPASVAAAWPQPEDQQRPPPTQPQPRRNPHPPTRGASFPPHQQRRQPPQDR